MIGGLPSLSSSFIGISCASSNYFSAMFHINYSCQYRESFSLFASFCLCNVAFLILLLRIKETQSCHK